MDKDLMLVYEAVEKKLDDTYENVFYHTMREDQPGDVGIYLYDSSQDVEDMSGNEVYNCVKVQIQVNAESGVAGMSKALKYLARFINRIENEPSNVNGIHFVSAQHLQRGKPIGKNDYNILICRCVVDLKYTFETDNSLIQF